MEAAEQALNAPVAAKLLNPDQIAVGKKEIAEYHKDAAAYVADLTGERLRGRRAKNPNQNPVLAKVDALKEKIRTFYDNTLDALVRDLRIFSASNLCASVFAFWFAFRSRTSSQTPVVWFSFLLFASVLFCSYQYIDDLTFYRIIWRTHMGWSYPFLLCVMTVSLFLKYGRGSGGDAALEKGHEVNESARG